MLHEPLEQESFSPPSPPHTVHACRGLILKDLWAEIFFASAAAATLIVKTEQVTIRMWKEEDGRGRGHKASRRFKIRDNGRRADRKAGAVFWSANHRCFVLYVLLLRSLRDVDKQF